MHAAQIGSQGGEGTWQPRRSSETSHHCPPWVHSLPVSLNVLAGAALMHCTRSVPGALSTLSQEQEMTDSTRSEHGIDSPTELPIQPTGNGITDMEIAKLQAAVDDGAEDPSIETPIPNDESTTTQD